MHPTTIKKRLKALQDGRALLEEAADLFESACAYKIACGIDGYINVAEWEINYFIEQHLPIVERKTK